jgi:aldehyde:ferredoxin oxidoreductase
MCLNDNVESIIKANDICNQYGMDTISVGAICAFAIDCYENGVITKADTDGLELTWGNHAAIVALTEKIGKREGFGNLLAEGARRAAEEIGRGAEELAMHVNGQELPMHDPRLFPGLGTGYLMEATPGRHCQGTEDWPQPGLKVGSHGQREYAGRGRDHFMQQAVMHITNVQGVCQFGTYTLPMEHMVEFLNAATGWDTTWDELFVTGDRIANIRHLFNLREGQNPLKWYFSPRVLGVPPRPSGPLGGVRVDIATLSREYVEYMQWDTETAMPKPEKLSELGMVDLVEKYGAMR